MSGGDGPAPLTSPEVSVKLFVEDPAGVRLKELISVFHRWIAEKLIDDELLVDVASYEHVPRGPGIVLICDKAHYYFDVRDGRPGIRYRGRRDADVVGEQGIARAFRSTLQAASLLENDLALDGRYRFITNELEFGIYDRLRAPSDQATFEAVQPDLEKYVKTLYGADEVSLELTSGPKEPFMVSIKAGTTPAVEELLGQVAAASA